MAKTKHGLPETKGQYRMKGLATGLQRDNAFNNMTFTSGSERNSLNLGVKIDNNATVYTTLEGFKSKQAYLFKQSEEKGKSPEQKIVDWDQRYDFEEDGFKVIGTRLGLEQDEKGKNVLSTLTQFDAAEEVHSSLKDDTSIYVAGRIDFSSYKNREGELKRMKKLLVDNLYLAKDVDFEAEDFTPYADFQQKILFMSIEKQGDKFVVEAKIVGRDSIEPTEFVIYDRNLANTFKSKLKPYNAIEVSGKISVFANQEEVKEADVWGEENSFTKQNGTVIREYVITGAKPSTLDAETYTESKVEEAIKKLAEEGQQANSSNSSNTKNDSGEVDWGVEISEDDLPF